MTAFANFRALAKGQSHVQEFSTLPDTKTPGVSLTMLFGFQSYYSDTLFEKAILAQTVNSPIVASTLQKSNISGYSFGLHPSSQTPVAIQPIVGGQTSSAQAVILRPGQIYRPHGQPGKGSGNFSGFNWGLPFGWLGGGIATLYVFPSPDADVAWPGNAEVLFHRQAMRVYGATFNAGVVPDPADFNWPMRFPWPHAVRGANSIDQTGAAIIAISEPTRILVSPEANELDAPATIRMFFMGDNDFDLDSSGAPILTQARFVDFTLGTYAPPAGLAATNYNNGYVVQSLPDEAVRLAADDGGVMLWSLDNADMDGAVVDLARYGKI